MSTSRSICSRASAPNLKSLADMIAGDANERHSRIFRVPRRWAVHGESGWRIQGAAAISTASRPCHKQHRRERRRQSALLLVTLAMRTNAHRSGSASRSRVEVDASASTSRNDGLGLFHSLRWRFSEESDNCLRRMQRMLDAPGYHCRSEADLALSIRTAASRASASPPQEISFQATA